MTIIADNPGTRHDATPWTRWLPPTSTDTPRFAV